MWSQEVKGDAQKTVGNVKDTASDAYDSATSSSTADKASGHANDAIGNAKQTVGRAVGSDRLEAEGLAQEAKGEAQKISGDVKKTFQPLKSRQNGMPESVSRRNLGSFFSSTDLFLCRKTLSTAREPAFRGRVLRTSVHLSQEHLPWAICCSIVFLVVALVAAFLGFGGVAGNGRGAPSVLGRDRPVRRIADCRYYSESLTTNYGAARLDISGRFRMTRGRPVRAGESNHGRSHSRTTKNAYHSDSGLLLSCPWAAPVVVQGRLPYRACPTSHVAMTDFLVERAWMTSGERLLRLGSSERCSERVI